MKKYVALMLAALMTTASLAGCGSSTSSSSSSVSSSSSSVSSSVSSSTSSSVSSESSSLPVTSAPVSEDAEPTLEDIHQAMMDAYGENYIPSMAIDETMLSEVYGIDTANVEEFIAEGPMISFHVDMFIAIKAKEGKGEAVETQLSAYRDTLVNDALQYPTNLAKVEASQVIRHGDYVFFVMLGAIDERTDITEEQSKAFAEEQMQVAVDVLNGFFGA